jgi:hypothetical protein
MMKTLRKDFFVPLVDSMRLITEGMLLGPWMQAKTRNLLAVSSFEL